MIFKALITTLVLMALWPNSPWGAPDHPWGTKGYGLLSVVLVVLTIIWFVAPGLGG